MGSAQQPEQPLTSPSPDSEVTSSQAPPAPDAPPSVAPLSIPAAIPTAPAPGRHMGELARGEQQWDVYLETRSAASAPGRFHTVSARLHFVAGGRRRSTGWIFIEASEQAVAQRFAAFSASELWHLVESLG